MRIDRYTRGELIILAVILIAYAFIWVCAEDRVAKDAGEKELSLSTVNNAVQGGLIAVSILLPVCAGLLVLVIDKGKEEGRIAELVTYLRGACLYLFASLVFGLLNLFRIPTVALQKDILIGYDKWTAFFEVCQLFLLGFGIWRLVCGIRACPNGGAKSGKGEANA